MPVRKQEESLPVTSQATLKVNAQAIVTLILAALVILSFFQTYKLTQLAQGQGLPKTQTPVQGQQPASGVQSLPAQQGGC